MVPHLLCASDIAGGETSILVHVGETSTPTVGAAQTKRGGLADDAGLAQMLWGMAPCWVTSRVLPGTLR
jgi:hypothetical protein